MAGERLNRRSFLALLGTAPIAALAPWRPPMFSGVDLASGPDRAFIWLDPGPRPFGLAPGVTQQRYVVIDGHHRLAAMRALGVETDRFVRCVFEGDGRWGGGELRLEAGAIHEVPLRVLPAENCTFEVQFRGAS